MKTVFHVRYAYFGCCVSFPKDCQLEKSVTIMPKNAFVYGQNGFIFFLFIAFGDV
jgi:hypothetical protein